MDIISEFENGDTIARIDGYDMPLYRAAPDLLAALEYLLEQTIGQDQQYGIELSEGEAIAEQKALAAIAKVKGN